MHAAEESESSKGVSDSKKNEEVGGKEQGVKEGESERYYQFHPVSAQSSACLLHSVYSLAPKVLSEFLCDFYNNLTHSHKHRCINTALGFVCWFKLI